MKTGVIVYVVGKENIEKDFDMTEAVKNLKIRADKVEIVSSISGHFDVMDAWWLPLVPAYLKHRFHLKI